MKEIFYPLVENPYSNDDIAEGVKVLRSKKLTIANKTIKFEKSFKEKLKASYSLMVNSGSSANLLALQCLINPYRKNRLNKGDEVIIPTLCWSTSLWPIVQSNLKPIFVDINKETLNIDESQIEKKITKKTKAILLVHVLGNSCNMEIILKIKKKYNLILIEDTCESLGSKYKDKFLGTFGEFSSFSFYSSHQISSGEGGMICCKDLNDYNIIKSMRSHGWSRGTSYENKFNKNKNLDKRFVFFNSGYNLRPLEVSAAIGLNQFKKIDKFIETRNNIAARYNQELLELPISLPTIAEGNKSSYHLYVIKIQDDFAKVKPRDQIYKELIQEGVGVNLHYLPVHLHPYYKNLGFYKNQYPISENYADNALSIPIFYGLTNDQQSKVIQALKIIIK